MRLPDFLLIGAAKSGTTALFHYLGQHPDIYPSVVREPNFFALEGKALDFAGPGDRDTIGRNSVTDIRTYAALFAPATGRQAASEASALYLYADDAPQRIKNRIPEVRLLVILRNPVDRAYASYLHLRRDGRETCEDFGEAFSLSEERAAAGWEHLWHYRQMGNYATQLRRYYGCFDAAQIKPVLYDDFSRRPAEVLRDCFAFLGVDEGFTPDFSRRPNRSGIPWSKFLQKITSGRGPIRHALARSLPERLRGEMVTRIQEWNLSRPEMDVNIRKYLTDGYRAEIIELQSMLGWDLNNWLEYDGKTGG